MTCKSFFTFCFVFAFGTCMLANYAWVKTPSQSREVASWNQPVKPMYDASWKL